MELRSNNFSSIKYHDIFDFKLTKEELVRWQYKQSLPSAEGKNLKETTRGIKNKSRLQREIYSQEKLKIAKKTAKLISILPTVKFIGITGALAMNNAGKNSDIDLMIVTSHNKLWTTRLLVYGLLWVTDYKLRKPKNDIEKDRLCLNLWLDEQDLVWSKSDRNIYTAHEIAQIVPLINKDKTYEKFLWENRWILNFWPNSVEILNPNIEKLNKSQLLIFNSLNLIAYKLQYLYMKPKITREVVTLTRAIFHPNDWGKVVIAKLSS